jgi:hypothetical protein
VERVTGIEPALPAWKAGTLPLSYTRVDAEDIGAPTAGRTVLLPRLGTLNGTRALQRAENGAVGEGGFEPPTACPQSRHATELRHSPLSYSG